MSEAKTTGTIAAIGNFDGVHIGHLFLLGKLKALAESRGESSAVITFSTHPLEIIRPERVPPTITPLEDKVRSIRAAGIDRVIVMDFDNDLRNLSARDFMLKIKEEYGVSALLLGYDTRFGHDRPKKFSDYEKLGREVGIEVLGAPELSCGSPSISSSTIRKAIAKGDIGLANTLLSGTFRIAGTVGQGKQLGRTIGFPTANIEPLCAALIIPAAGVYAVMANLPDGSSRRGMLNIGYRPTVDSSAEPKLTIELHLLDYDGDLYGQQVSVELKARLRDERKFDSVEALRRQLLLDKVAATAALIPSAAKR